MAVTFGLMFDRRNAPAIAFCILFTLQLTPFLVGTLVKKGIVPTVLGQPIYGAILVFEHCAKIQALLPGTFWASFPAILLIVAVRRIGVSKYKLWACAACMACAIGYLEQHHVGDFCGIYSTFYNDVGNFSAFAAKTWSTVLILVPAWTPLLARLFMSGISHVFELLAVLFVHGAAQLGRLYKKTWRLESCSD